MENSTKAIIIAGGMFILIMVITLLVVFGRSLSSYMQGQHDKEIVKQVTEFNNKFAGMLYCSELTNWSNISSGFNGSLGMVWQNEKKNSSITFFLNLIVSKNSCPVQLYPTVSFELCNGVLYK